MTSPTTTLGWTPAALRRFDRACNIIGARGRGLSMDQLGDAGALARALDAEDVDPERVEALAARLGLSAGELAEVES